MRSPFTSFEESLPPTAWRYKDDGNKQEVVRLSHQSLTHVPPHVGQNNPFRLSGLFIDHNRLSNLILPHDLPRLRILVASHNPLTSLDGLSQCGMLETVVLDHCNLSSIDDFPSVRIERISLDSNRLSSLARLSGLAPLIEISFENNRVSSIEFLREKKALASIAFSHNPISDLEPLRSLHMLTVLSCSACLISTLEPLSHLTRLIDLDFSRNMVSSVQPLCNLSKLGRLNIAYNPIDSLLSLSSIFQVPRHTAVTFDADQRSIMTPLCRLCPQVTCILSTQVAEEDDIVDHSPTLAATPPSPPASLASPPTTPTNALPHSLSSTSPSPLSLDPSASLSSIPPFSLSPRSPPSPLSPSPHRSLQVSRVTTSPPAAATGESNYEIVVVEKSNEYVPSSPCPPLHSPRHSTPTAAAESNYEIADAKEEGEYNPFPTLAKLQLSPQCAYANVDDPSAAAAAAAASYQNDQLSEDFIPFILPVLPAEHSNYALVQRSPREASSSSRPALRHQEKSTSSTSAPPALQDCRFTCFRAPAESIRPFRLTLVEWAAMHRDRDASDVNAPPMTLQQDTDSTYYSTCPSHAVHELSTNARECQLCKNERLEKLPLPTESLLAALSFNYMDSFRYFATMPPLPLLFRPYPHISVADASAMTTFAQFNATLSFFMDTTHFLMSIWELLVTPCFYGRISSSDAAALVHNKPGYFLVRFSSVERNYTITLCTRESRVRHIRLEIQVNRREIIIRFEGHSLLTKDEEALANSKFSTLRELIAAARRPLRLKHPLSASPYFSVVNSERPAIVADIRRHYGDLLGIH